MNLSERDDIRHAITQVMGFYGKELTDVQGKLWLRAIGHLPYDLTRQALADYPSIGKHAPKPVEIIGMVRDKQDQKRRADARKALPGPDDALPCDAEVANAWRYAIHRWGLGMFPQMAETDPDTAERYVEIVNRQVARSGQWDAIPEEIHLQPHRNQTGGARA